MKKKELYPEFFLNSGLNLKKVKMRLPINGITVVCGDNSCGKTVLLKMLRDVIISGTERCRKFRYNVLNGLWNHSFSPILKCLEYCQFDGYLKGMNFKNVRKNFEKDLKKLSEKDLIGDNLMKASNLVFKLNDESKILNNFIKDIKSISNVSKFSFLLKDKEYLKKSNVNGKAVITSESVKDYLLDLICDLEVSVNFLETKLTMRRGFGKADHTNDAFNYLKRCYYGDGFDASLTENGNQIYKISKNKSKKDFNYKHSEILSAYDDIIYLDNDAWFFMDFDEFSTLHYKNYGYLKFGEWKSEIPEITKESDNISVAKDIWNILGGYVKAKNREHANFWNFYSDNGKEYFLGDLSSAFRSLGILGVLLDCGIISKKTLLIFDDFDIYFLPNLEMKFAKMLWDLVTKIGCSIIISTHNSSLIKALGKFSTLGFYKTQDKLDFYSFEKLSENEYTLKENMASFIIDDLFNEEKFFRKNSFYDNYKT